MAELKLQQSRLDGRYDLIECLGRGSYAEIYVAKDNAAPEGGPTKVVIKALNVSLQETPDADLERTLVANFQNEAVALDLVRHPHIISRLGHGTAIDLVGTIFHYIVLEYLPGGDMAAFARSRPILIDQTMAYLEQVCSGLAHAHRCGVIHRDIKPQNLLLSADQKLVKIADFGVARLDTTEGSITRVGTNIYSAPEHNPQVQTGQLDTNLLALPRYELTPAADIYSLAKTTYFLLAGEPPRRFAQHPITELPTHIGNEGWSEPVLRVLEKATQTRVEKRYQSVFDFWDDLHDAAASQPDTDNQVRTQKPSADLIFDSDEVTQAPPRPKFEIPHLEQHVVNAPSHSPSGLDSVRRPRIVVPIKSSTETRSAAHLTQQRSNGRAAHPESDLLERQPPSVASRSRRFTVALILIFAFSGMLLATHKYVTTHWNPLVRLPHAGEFTLVGREGFTTTDVNLRPTPSVANPPVGIAPFNSRVKVLSENNNWYEIQVLQYGRPKADPLAADRGWVNKRFLRLN